jgi:hypothetical protein
MSLITKGMPVHSFFLEISKELNEPTDPLVLLTRCASTVELVPPVGSLKLEASLMQRLQRSWIIITGERMLYNLDQEDW